MHLPSDDITDAYIRSNMKLTTANEDWELYDDGVHQPFAVPTKKTVKDSLNARISFARVPSAYSLVRLSSIDPEYYTRNMARELMTIQDYVSAFPKHYAEGLSLYIWSHVLGSGKTMTACAIANELIEKGYVVMFMTTGTMLMKLKETFGDKAKQSTEQVINSYKQCDLLILDDAGTENITSWVDEVIFEVINARYLSHKPTVFTSNYDVSELEYNKRIIDRIKSDCTILHWPEEGVRSAIGDMKRKEQEKEWQQTSLPGIA